MGKKAYVKYIVPVILTGFICWFLFTKPEVCTSGVKNGILLSAEVVIPSLFPFMVVSSFILKSGLGGALGKLFDKFTKAVFHLPGVCAPVIIMSQIGGFPIGAKMTSELLKSKSITINEARRMDIFCINAGPAFVIGSVGSIMFGSTKAGLVIYISTVLASLFTGIFTVALQDKNEKSSENGCRIVLKDPVGAFVSSTADSAITMVNICAWVVIFKTICDILASLSLTDGVKLFLDCVLEVANGCSAAAGKLPIPAIAAVISFGGFSVHCQVLSYIRETGLKMRYFYTGRVVCASFSAMICMELLKVFPCEISVFATNPDITLMPYSVSVPALAALLIMSALLIFEVDTNKKIC